MSSSESTSDEIKARDKTALKRRKKVSKGITPLVAATTYPDDIKTEAINHYAKLDVENSKNIKRRKLACYCICQAHIILGYDNPDPIAIGEGLGLEKKHAKAAASLNLRYKKGHTSNIVSDSYESIMRDYLINNCSLIEEDADNFIKSFFAFLTKYPIFRAKQPNTVIAAFILHNVEVYGYEVECSEIAKDFNLSTSTVKTMHNDILRALVK